MGKETGSGEATGLAMPVAVVTAYLLSRRAMAKDTPQVAATSKRMGTGLVTQMGTPLASVLGLAEALASAGARTVIIRTVPAEVLLGPTARSSIEGGQNDN